MGLKIEVDSSQLKGRLREIALGRQKARKAAIRLFGRFAIEEICRIAPTDTNRYLRGWIMAGRDAGVTERSPPALVESQRREAWLRSLQRQLDRRVKYLNRLNEAKARWYDDNPKRAKRGYYRKLLRLIATAERRVEAAKEWLRRADASRYFIFIGDGKAKTAVKRNYTIRDKVYGGEGRIIEVQGTGRSTLELHNKEVHARFIERRLRIWSRARAIALVRTKMAMKKAYLAAAERR